MDHSGPTAPAATAPLLAHARALWVELAGAPVRFGPTGDARIVVSPASRWCPPSWCGFVRIGDAALVTAPDRGTAARVAEATRGLPPEALVDPAYLSLPVREVLGPAALFYADGSTFLPTHEAAGVEEHADVGRFLGPLLARVDQAEAEESALTDIDSPAFCLGSGGGIVAAAGYEVWAGRAAHLSVLVAPEVRGRGLARAVASAAVAHALDAGLLAQWRARPVPSQRVARALGFRELGAQLSVRVPADQSP
ncbi:GNAT family N-acetyltransferase [Streptomyces sp. NPDC087440]|uniref:GNAT family N-acetyltransferase n=1 Tax=Streptomyces sp. NPDC087440 TaxID=3365790 RepID=UPI0037FCA8DF